MSRSGGSWARASVSHSVGATSAAAITIAPKADSACISAFFMALST